MALLIVDVSTIGFVLCYDRPATLNIFVFFFQVVVVALLLLVVRVLETAPSACLLAVSDTRRWRPAAAFCHLLGTECIRPVLCIGLTVVVSLLHYYLFFCIRRQLSSSLLSVLVLFPFSRPLLSFVL